MSSHPTASNAPTEKLKDAKGFQDPLQEDPFPDDLEFPHESGKERFFGYLKWILFLGGISAALYFGGEILRGYWISDLEQKLIVKNQEIEVLKKSSHESFDSIRFEVVVKQVTSSPRGKAYLLSDSMGQPWFAMSGSDFKVGEKTTLEIKKDSEGKGVAVALLKSEGSVSVEGKVNEEKHSSHEEVHGEKTEKSGHH